jgi:hypothetical protein
MTQFKHSFKRTDLKKKTDSFTVWLNKEERAELDRAKNILEQPKDSTALKTLASLGSKLLGDQKIRHVLETVFENKRKNKRLGIIDYE